YSNQVLVGRSMWPSGIGPNKASERNRFWPPASSISEAETAMRAPFGQKALLAPAAPGSAATGAGAGWAAADFAANAAALAMPSAVSTSRRELMVHSFRPKG